MTDKKQLISFAENIKNAYPESSGYHQIAVIALAALTAGPFGYTCQTEIDGIKKGNTTRIVSYCTKGDPLPVYLCLPEASAVPAGWQLVPVWPTTEMIQEIHPIAVGTCHRCGCEVNPDCEDNIIMSWQDMLAAAPSPVQGE